MRRIEYLSYSVSEDTPLYGNGSGIKFSPDKQIQNGDSCNTMNITIPNHSGTHIDLPYHINANGLTLSDYPPDFWRFRKVALVDMTGTVVDAQIITPEMLPEVRNKEIDLLLIKTGYGNFRGTDRYTLTPPGLSSLLAAHLRIKYPFLRCLGMDLISISSYSNRKEGRKAHHAFLNPTIGTPILLIEDMKLDLDDSPNEVIVAPLRINHADGVPCTIFSIS